METSLSQSFYAPANAGRRLAAYSAALGLLILVSVAYVVTSWQSVRNRHDRELGALVAMGTRALETYFGDLEVALSVLGEQVLEQGLRGDIETRLHQFAARHPDLQFVGVTLPDGRNIANTETRANRPYPNISQNPSFVDTLQHFANGETMVVGQPFIGPVSGKWRTPVRYAVRDRQGKLAFVLVVSISQESTNAFWRDAPLPPGAAMGILRDDFYLVSRYPIPDTTEFMTRPVDGPLPTFLHAHHYPNHGQTMGESTATRREATFVFQRMRRFPLTFFINNPRANLWIEWLAASWLAFCLMLVLFIGGVVIVKWYERQYTALLRERDAQFDAARALAAGLERSNRELEVANRDLQNANQEMAAFTYSVSHDLQGPIRAILGFAELVAKDQAAGGSPRQGELIARIRGGAIKMHALLNDLLDLSRFSNKALHRERANPADHVHAVLAELDDQRHNTTIEIGMLPPYEADPLLIQQVWHNLISNALKFTRGVAAPRVRIAFEDGWYVVEDNGAGFDMQFGEKLFKLFSRLHNERDYPGTGVGLAIVKRIVERHGGWVVGAGQPGAGARFAFRLDPTGAVAAATAAPAN